MFRKMKSINVFALAAAFAVLSICPIHAQKFTQVRCENKAFAPQRLSSGQFTTGPCPSGRDDECSENCCDFNGKCRAPLALTPGVEFCRNGFTPQFSGPPCQSAEEAIGQPLGDSGNAPDPTDPPVLVVPDGFGVAQCRNTDFAPVSGPGTKVPTSDCSADEECLTGCCDLNGKCRVSFALKPNGGEFCRGGFSPVFSGPPCQSIDEAILGPVNGQASTSQPTAAPTTTNIRGERPISFVVPQCRNTKFAPASGPGNQFITGVCNFDDDECASGCCDLKLGRCRAALALKTGVEFCMNGFTPVFSGSECDSLNDAIGAPIFQGDNNAPPNVDQPPNEAEPVLPVAFTVPNCRNRDFRPAPGLGSQFTTGPCKEDADCVESCCDLNGKCRAPLALRPGQEFCRNGFTPVFDAPPERRTCANIEEAIGDPIFDNDNNGGNQPTPNPTPAPTEPPTPAPTLANPSPPLGEVPVAFTVPNCRNAQFNPAAQDFARGPVFTTGPCSKSSDCQEACCDLNGKCRGPLALKPGEEFCRDNGFTPVFDAAPERRNCANLEEAFGEPIFASDPNAPPVQTPAPTPAPTIPAEQPLRFQTPTCRNRAFGPQRKSQGQFTTGPCNVDGDCQTNCCDFNNRCRVPEALATGLEFCRNGFTPVFNGPVCQSRDEAIGAPVVATRAAKAYTTPSCANFGYANVRDLGDKIISEACDTDSQCDTGCCELNTKICISPLLLDTGKQWCTNGWTPKFDGTPCNSQRLAIGDPIVDGSQEGDSGSNVGLIVGVMAAVGLAGAAFVHFRNSGATEVTPASPSNNGASGIFRNSFFTSSSGSSSQMQSYSSSSHNYKSSSSSSSSRHHGSRPEGNRGGSHQTYR